jgi:hypothetical protein
MKIGGGGEVYMLKMRMYVTLAFADDQIIAVQDKNGRQRFASYIMTRKFFRRYTTWRLQVN